MPEKPFSRNLGESEHTDMGWLSQQGFGHLGFAYREAADVLCEAPSTHDVSEEAMYLVASFAYRQSIELYLKSILSIVEVQIGKSHPQKTRGGYQQIRGGHRLLPMWDRINSVLGEAGLDPLSEDARSVVEDFERVDPNGTAFRYNLNLQGDAQLNRLPLAVSLGNLQKAASEAIHYLDGTEESMSEVE